MVTLYDAILDAANGGLCALADLSGRLTPPQPLRSLDLLDPARSAFRNFVAGRFCNKPPIQPPNDFFGGQCPGDSYQIDFLRISRFWDDRPDLVEPAQSGGLGPISSLTTQIIGSNGGLDRYDVVIQDGNGVRPLGVSAQASRVFDPFWPQEIVFTNFILTNVSDPSDACGNAGPSIGDYDPADFTINNIINYTANDGNNYDLEIQLVYAPAYLDANLNVNIPVDIKLNPSINPSLNQKFDLGLTLNVSTGGASFNFPRDPQLPRPKPPIPPDTRPPAYEAPDAPPPPPDIPEPPPEPEQRQTRRVIKAALVTVVASDPRGKVGVFGQGDNPDIAIPNYGYVNFLCRAGTLSGGWTPDQAVKIARCFIPCPWEGGAYDVKGTPQVGVEFIISPVYMDIPVSV